ncbi:unnamed protein product [Blepharisma stoltei]|uniref:TmcB/TmcC TPR repeats domain-containing protein n=1 Tax=Blepharisma stoltei TaxID=1481888 RepID=A0AAU9IAH7_9CILI|nr:unnamed protein product [Blepharisma stoltei]
MVIHGFEIGEYPVHNARLWKAKTGKTLKHSIFEFYSKLYHAQNRTVYIGDESLLSQKVKETFIATIWCFQTITLLWIPQLAIKNWAENRTIWEIIGFLRLDNISSELGITFEYFYLSIIMIFIIVLCIIVLILLDYLSQNIPNLVISALRWIFDLWKTAFLTPSLTLYSVFLKYNFSSKGHISAYKNNNDPADFELNAAWQFVIILTMTLIFVLIISYEEFIGEIRHSVSIKVLKAKAHSKVDVHIAIFMYFSPILYAITNEDFMVYFQLFMMIVSLILIAEIMIFLPYFSLCYCFIKILGLFAIALVSFGFILGYLMDNSLVIILVAIILGPFLAFFALQFTLKLQNKLSVNVPETLSGIESAYQLEKSLRCSLCSNDAEHKEQIINLYEAFFNKAGSLKNKLQLIWAANYCLFTLKDESLAKVKLSRIKNILEWNLEADFQEYLINNTIQDSLSSESSRFISYLQQLHLIKTSDINLCINLLKFWEEITSSKPDLDRLTKRLTWISKKMQLLANKYSQLITKFIDCREFLSLYASFMKDIILDRDKANFLGNKLKTFNADIMNSGPSQLSCFDDLSAILIISVEEDSFGQILFSNKKAKDVMKFNSPSIDGSNIMSFIPSYYCEKLKDYAIGYSHFCFSSEIDLNGGFFLELPSEYLIECTGKASITTIENFLVFILIFKQSQKKNKIALLSENGEILCYSKYFAEMAGKENNNLIGCNIKNIFNETEQYLANNGTTSESRLICSSIHACNIEIFYAAFISGCEEIQRWENKSSEWLPDKKRKNKKTSHDSLDLLVHEYPNKGIKNEYEGKVSFNSEMNLKSGKNKIHEITEKRFSENFSEEKSESWQNKKLINLVASSSRKINILHAAFILSVKNI